jgi:hypothetical protein
VTGARSALCDSTIFVSSITLNDYVSNSTHHQTRSVWVGRT